MKRLLFIIAIVVPGVAEAQDNPWADLTTKPTHLNQFDQRLNRAVQLGQLEQLERQKVRDDFEPFEGLFPHRDETMIGKAIQRAGENSAVEYRMKQKLNSPFEHLGE